MIPPELWLASETEARIILESAVGARLTAAIELAKRLEHEHETERRDVHRQRKLSQRLQARVKILLKLSDQELSALLHGYLLR